MHICVFVSFFDFFLFVFMALPYINVNNFIVFFLRLMPFIYLITQVHWIMMTVFGEWRWVDFLPSSYEIFTFNLGVFFGFLLLIFRHILRWRVYSSTSQFFFKKRNVRLFNLTFSALRYICGFLPSTPRVLGIIGLLCMMSNGFCPWEWASLHPFCTETWL